MSSWQDSLDRIVEQQAALAEEARSRLEAAKTLKALAVKHRDLIIAFADTLRSIAPPVEDKPRSTRQVELLHTVLLAHRKPVDTDEISIMAGIPPSIVEKELKNHPELFESHPHPDYSSRRRWGLRHPTGRIRLIDDDSAKPGPTAAIIRWFQHHPEGGTAGQIANDLRDLISTSSGDAANVIHGVLSTMSRRGRLESKEHRGQKYYIPNEKLFLIDESS